MDDSREVVSDFRLRSTAMGFESYRTTDYRIFHKLEEHEMIPRLDDHLNKLLAGEVDDGNGEMLDDVIFGAAREAIADLERQHADHIDMLRRLTIRRLADNEDVRRVRDARVQEYEALQKHYEKICKAVDEQKEVL